MPLDLNHDGVVDFNLVERHYPYVGRMRGPSCCFHESQSLNVNGAGNPGAGVMGTAYSPFDAGALVLGAEIGPGLHFDRVQNANALMAQAGFFTARESKLYSFCDGPFAGFAACTGTTDRFLGLRFQVSGNTYYGWAGFSVVKVGYTYIHARLVGIAYEDVPGQPIRAGQLQDGTVMTERTPNPQPATLGLLALGAPGLDIWRPRKQV